MRGFEQAQPTPLACGSLRALRACWHSRRALQPSIAGPEAIPRGDKRENCGYEEKFGVG
jgi:hypothetical protein